MDTPKLVFYEHSFEDPIKTSLAKSVLNLGIECRALADENKELKSKIERLLHEINYWRIEAETDHGRWLRCLEQLEEVRNLK